MTNQIVWSLITWSILPAVSPPLKHLTTVKLRFPQLHVDSVVHLTHPLTELIWAGHAGRMIQQVLPQVLSTVLTRVETRECVQECSRVRLLLLCWCPGEVSCHRVKQSPGLGTQLQSVRWTLMMISRNWTDFTNFSITGLLVTWWRFGFSILTLRSSCLHPVFEVSASSAWSAINLLCHDCVPWCVEVAENVFLCLFLVIQASCWETAFFCTLSTW